MLDDIKKLEIGKQQEIQVLIKNVEVATSRLGEKYQKVFVRDKNDHEAIFFNFKAPIEGNFPMVVNAKVDTSDYREAACSKFMDYKIDNKEKADAFLPKPQVNYKELIAQLGKWQKAMRPSLRMITKEILNENYNAFAFYPFSKSGIFARTCGILEATWKLTTIAEKTAAVTGLDKDLILSGAMLYYIGKTQTINNSYDYTEDDVLFGDGLSAAVMVQLKVKEIMDREGSEEEKKIIEETKDIKLLTHILASRSKGVLTAIPEANALRYLDMMVCDTEAMKYIQKDESSGSVVTERSVFPNRVFCR